MFLDVIGMCIFTLKAFGLIDLTWWIVAPVAFLSAMEMMEYTECRK